MYIAKLLKEKNIAEYLIYMWQLEDLIRAYDCDVSRIKTDIVDQYQVEEEKERLKIFGWYESLIGMMRQEGVTEKGHLQINKNVIINLTELHLSLLRSAKEPFYGAAYYKALPCIVELRSKSGKTDEPELETCFEALYGLMLLKLQKCEITPQTIKAVAEIGKFLSLLANYYEKDKKGELNIE